MPGRSSVYDLPTNVQYVIGRCRAGQTLRLSHEGDRAVYRLHPSNRYVPAGAAKAAIDTPFLIPQPDGLFGADCPQSWTAEAAR